MFYFLIIWPTSASEKSSLTIVASYSLWQPQTPFHNLTYSCLLHGFISSWSYLFMISFRIRKWALWIEKLCLYYSNLSPKPRIPDPAKTSINFFLKLSHLIFMMIQWKILLPCNWKSWAQVFVFLGFHCYCCYFWFYNTSFGRLTMY